MHIDIVPNRNSKPAVLLRESYRDAKSKKPRKRTLANLSKLPSEQVDAIRRILKGQKLVSLEDAFEIVENGSGHHGHVDAVLSAMRQLGFEKLVGSRHSPERDLVVANKRLQRWKRHMGTIVKQLERIRQRIGRGQLHGKDKIGVRVGKVLNKYKVGKHFKLDIRDDSFSFEIDDTKVTTEAALDGIYVIRISLAEQRMKTDDTVRSYKLLTQVERAFRSFKSMDLKVRPIRHRRENRVRAHIFLCMLAYYVLWHMMEVWRPLVFSDEEQQAKAERDPVASAQRSDAALRKIHTKKLDDGRPASSFRTLLRLLSNIVRNKCRRPEAGPDEPTFDVTTTPDSKQQRAYDLLKGITV